MAANENLMDKSFHTNTWMAAVTGHSPDCRGVLGHSSEPAIMGYFLCILYLQPYLLLYGLHTVPIAS